MAFLSRRPGPGLRGSETTEVFVPAKKKASDDELVESYFELKSVWKVAKQFHMCGQSVHERLSKLGLICSGKWTKEDDLQLIQLYGRYTESMFLESIAKAMGRTKAAIACRANELGLTTYFRPKSQTSKDKLSVSQRERLSKQPHPRGMLGKKHSPETLQLISESSKDRASNYSEEDWAKRGEKITATKIKNGTVNPNINRDNPYSRTKSGKRYDLNNQYFRSKTEANYARYLNLLGHTWEYEPKEFYFEGIRKGCISYTPDFYNKTLDRWIEVKGWFDDRSKTKMKRFKKYYPSEFSRLVMITQSRKTMEIAIEMGIPYERYEDIATQCKNIIRHWE